MHTHACKDYPAIDYHNNRSCSDTGIVSSPDPAPKREKGLVYIERFLGLVSEF